jgi:phytol kinase
MAFWIAQALIVGSLALTAYLCGLLVRHGNVRVNYTRKINFFALFLIPKVVTDLIPQPPSFAATAMRTVLFIGALACFAQPIRDRVPGIRTMFLSYDRPEDRPHTLSWLITQLVAGYLVFAPMSAYFTQQGLSRLLFIPIFTHGIGDGLAEPVGVRFGRHRYTTWALFTRKRYVRSLEGSACVLLVGILTVAIFRGGFSPAQFWVALLTTPLLMTIAEAVSPHTWDTPLMFLAGGLSLLAIVTFI